MNQEHIDYLEELRESGVTNMWAAAPYLEDRFDLSEDEASDILITWIRSKRQAVKGAISEY